MLQANSTFLVVKVHLAAQCAAVTIKQQQQGGTLVSSAGLSLLPPLSPKPNRGKQRDTLESFSVN